ncbi:MAG: aldo/keto reductase [Acidobacteria bacterium]|nr:aldo/keto reductase [Acidobacteriota bacterium]
MQRRSFFGGVFAGLAFGSSKAATAKAGEIPTRIFGKTGEKLTVIGQAGGRFPLCTFEEAKAIVLRAVDLGINYFDNAHSYWNGRSEEVYGEVLPAFRKKVFITTKSAKRSRKEAEAELHLSLKRLKTDYVDLWQIHAVNELKEVDEIFGAGGAIEAFESARKAGKCRFLGFTGHHDPHVHRAMLERYANYDTILMPLHIADPAYLSFEKLVLPKAVERGLGIQAMKTTANAKLLQSFNVKECLSYALSLPIHCAAIGCTTIGQLEDDVRVARGFKPFSATEMAALRERALRIKGPGLEDWKRNVERADAGRLYLGG